MKYLALLTWIVNLSTILGFSIHHHQQKSSLIKRFNSGAKRSSEHECTSVKLEEGTYTHTSLGTGDVCAFFIIGLVNQFVELEFQDFNIACEDGGLLEFVDGWETQRQIYPGPDDHPLPMDERYQAFCGPQSPRSIILASQNVALLQFRIPTAGQGFTVQIRFPDNYQPCNAMLMEPAGTLTLHNYGKANNCSISVLLPTSVSLINVDVGQTAEGLPAHNVETGLIHQCSALQHAPIDTLQLLDGNGLDPAYMWQQLDVCGMASTLGESEYQLGCHHSVIRLVSSGRYHNTVTFSYRQLTQPELEPLSHLDC